jgi:thiosulfate/3-mercaptopyruvate sulfurtransferase
VSTEVEQTTYEQKTGSDVLVEPQWLEEHLHDSNLRLVEVDVSPTSYDQGHIEGAILWNVYNDLKSPDYKLIDRTATERLVARSGIGPDTVVVFYGYAPAMGFWLMKLYGHADVRILNCARSTWQHECRPWTNEAGQPMATHYPLPEPDNRIRAGHVAIEDGIANGTSTIIDVRTEPEFRGDRFWPSGALEEGGRAGHVPSALHIPIDDIYDERGAFRPPPELRQLLSPIDLRAGSDVIFYCTIGGRASTAWFVLTFLIGREHVRVYDGSWAEWGLMKDTPVECG